MMWIGLAIAGFALIVAQIIIARAMEPFDGTERVANVEDDPGISLFGARWFLTCLTASPAIFTLVAFILTRMSNQAGADTAGLLLPNVLLGAVSALVILLQAIWIAKSVPLLVQGGHFGRRVAGAVLHEIPVFLALGYFLVQWLEVT